MKAKKTGIYKKWKERSHSKVYLKGDANDGNGEDSRSFAGNHSLGHFIYLPTKTSLNMVSREFSMIIKQ